jgi:hypothetical protein
MSLWLLEKTMCLHKPFAEQWIKQLQLHLADGAKTALQEDIIWDGCSCLKSDKINVVFLIPIGVYDQICSI